MKIATDALCFKPLDVAPSIFTFDFGDPVARGTERLQPLYAHQHRRFVYFADSGRKVERRECDHLSPVKRTNQHSRLRKCRQDRFQLLGSQRRVVGAKQDQ